MRKAYFLILILLLLNLLFLGRLIVVGSRSKETINTIHTLEQGKEFLQILGTLPVADITASRPHAPSVSEPSQESDIDEEELQRILQYVKHLEKTGDALEAANLGNGFARTTLSSYWATVESNQTILLQHAQDLANFVGLLDLSSLKPEEADLIHQFIEWRIRAANILYDGNVPVQEKVDISKALQDNYDTFKNNMTKAIELNYGKALTTYRDLHEKYFYLIRSVYPRLAGKHPFNSYIVTVPEGYQLEPLPKEDYYE